MSEQAYADALPTQYRLHWYVLERVLGQGGFGITYLARDTNLDQDVAIKEYLPVDVATRRPDASVRSRTDDQGERYRWGLDRFIREARTLAKFDHPNIVRVHSVFEVNNTAYMVMRFERGENLAALLDRRRTLPEDELLRIVLPILDGLALVHDAGFIHRDIKPDNIHIREDGSPVLLDFGSARLSMGHARTVTILVAPGYAPFEQYYSTGENQGPWTDLYSLGATCYRAIAGIAPMDAIARSKGILGSTREILVPAVNIGSGRYSPALLRAVDHALQFGEKDRPQSIAEWRRELTSSPTPPARSANRAPAPQASTLRGPLVWSILGALVAAATVVFLMTPAKSPGTDQTIVPPPTSIPDDPAKLKSAKEEEERQQRAAAQMRQAEDARKEQERIAALQAQNARLAQEKQQEAAALEAARKRLDAQKKMEEAALKERERKLASERLALDEREKKLAALEADRRQLAEQRKKDEAALKQRQDALAAQTKPAPATAPIPGAEPLALAEQAAKRGDEVERLELLHRAASQGNAQAMYELGDAYATGRGVIPNSFQAYVYLRRAQIAGYANAATRVGQVRAKLQPAEVEHAEKLLR
jgi:serine/threonine protein kinase